MNDAGKMDGYLVSVPVPWDEQGNVEVDLFRGAIGRLLQEGCDGMYLFGTSGEGYAVTDDEFRTILGIFAEETKGYQGFRQAGCFGLSSAQVTGRCSVAADCGLEGVQITLPFWKELNDAEMFRYFEEVCGTFPDLSFLLYNNPRNKRRLTGKELTEAKQLAPNLDGAKTGSGAWFELMELLTEAPSIRHFVTEPSFLFCHGLGAAGLIPSLNYARPNRCRRYYEAVVGGDLKTARDLHVDIVRFFYRTAVPLVAKGYIDGAIDKAYAKIGGMDIPLHMKSPYAALSAEDFEWLDQVIRDEFPED
jgi:dihydrodipicolinate synthase/N-acetylneuraminate lyase